MKKFYIFVLLFLCLKTISYAQPHQILCNLPKQNLKIENTSDIPTTTYNGDGTITLIHPDQNITNIFSNHTIYDFHQSYPSANPEGELIKYYTIVYESKDFINELYDYAYSGTYLLDQHESTPINSTLTNFLNNKTFRLIKECFESSETGSECPDSEQTIPEDIELKLTFNLDVANDILYIETNGLTPCGNSFSAGFKGGYDDGFGSTDNTLQLWISQPGISTLTDYGQECHYIERILYSMLDVACNGSNYGHIKVNTDNGESGQFVLEREHALFATSFLTFEEDDLSIKENSFKQMKPYKASDNPFLQISNSENQSVTVEIISITGQTILQNTAFETNAINLSHFSKGIYFIKLKSLNKQQKVFKFLNN